MQNNSIFYYEDFLLYAMFKKLRAKLPDWRFIAYVIANSIPGKRLGNWRFPPVFFAAGFLFEIVLCKLRINNINFYDVYKRKQAQEFVLKKHHLDDYLKTVSFQSPSTSTNKIMNPVRRLFYISLANTVAFVIGSQTAHVWLNPMKDYKDFILKAEADYQARQKELQEVDEYLKQKREDRLKQIS
ncbi:unnamed protein product [Adineta steineri]|uniref:Uncharacterized protein n=1 Tax=Adineta steineri TaxID=433720 RepID=A0A813Q4B3_9BILA|nr:unnamed protein product [Adineta steineri]CAF0745898.1 unnamed protein product [Adineta steineri]CAF0761834.1 unnamed protein product [Adineta steineri]CAF3488141.1 unnamed protein product [Adineta steineri]CAF3514025.1 unnamed protein product [Adineta steineri]